MTKAMIAAGAEAPTREEIQAKISLLSDEMDGVDEENRAMQAEIDELYRRADATSATADRDALLARAKLLADEMDANEEESSAMQEEIDALYEKLDSIDVASADSPGG
jgi:Skp family chaperone for outer membrane proteins